jgi:hypothetical protein
MADAQTRGTTSRFAHPSLSRAIAKFAASFQRFRAIMEQIETVSSWLSSETA